jgi:hypothetical protein
MLLLLLLLMLLLLQVRKIADIMLAETKQRVATKGIELAVGPRLLERMIQDGYSLEYGVRPLRQVGVPHVNRTGRETFLRSVKSGTGVGGGVGVGLKIGQSRHTATICLKVLLNCNFESGC